MSTSSAENFPSSVRRKGHSWLILLLPFTSLSFILFLTPILHIPNWVPIKTTCLFVPFRSEGQISLLVRGAHRSKEVRYLDTLPSSSLYPSPSSSLSNHCSSPSQLLPPLSYFPLPLSSPVPLYKQGHMPHYIRNVMPIVLFVFVSESKMADFPNVMPSKFFERFWVWFLCLFGRDSRQIRSLSNDDETYGICLGVINIDIL